MLPRGHDVGERAVGSPELVPTQRVSNIPVGLSGQSAPYLDDEPREETGLTPVTNRARFIHIRHKLIGDGGDVL